MVCMVLDVHDVLMYSVDIVDIARCLALEVLALDYFSVESGESELF